jgi:hypothetical protein
MLDHSLADIKQELLHLSHSELIAITTRILKFKKENKELAEFILFHEKQEIEFIAKCKSGMSVMFKDVNQRSVFLAKKTIRKIARTNTKLYNFSKSPIVGISIASHFCEELMKMKLDIRTSQTLVNMYASHLKKIEKYIATLHEDLQYDYKNLVNMLEEKL